MRIALENRRTGDRKWLAVGWNWNFLLFSPCLGIPLFFKGLPVWGAVMLTLGCFEFVTMSIVTGDSSTLQLVVVIAATFASGYLAWKGNALIAKKWLARGYEFVMPDSAEARYAREHWGVETSPAADC